MFTSFNRWHRWWREGSNLLRWKGARHLLVMSGPFITFLNKTSSSTSPYIPFWSHTKSFSAALTSERMWRYDWSRPKNWNYLPLKNWDGGWNLGQNVRENLLDVNILASKEKSKNNLSWICSCAVDSEKWMLATKQNHPRMKISYKNQANKIAHCSGMIMGFLPNFAILFLFSKSSFWYGFYLKNENEKFLFYLKYKENMCSSWFTSQFSPLGGHST